MARLLVVANRPAMRDAVHGSLPQSWLSASEQQRLSGIDQPKRREEFLACRYALRLLLVRNKNDIDQWRLTAQPNRAPTLSAELHTQALIDKTHFSLSHSGSYLACAVSPHVIGVDIETMARRGSRITELAQLVCTDQERRCLAGLCSETERRRQFMIFWSLKEAWFKQVGCGVDWTVLRRLECIQASNSVPAVAKYAYVWLAQTQVNEPISVQPAAVLTWCADLPLSPQFSNNTPNLLWQKAGVWRLYLQ